MEFFEQVILKNPRGGWLMKYENYHLKEEKVKNQISKYHFPAFSPKIDQKYMGNLDSLSDTK